MDYYFARELVKKHRGSLLKDLIGSYEVYNVGTLKDIATKHKLHSSYVSRLFKDCFGTGYHDRHRARENLFYYKKIVKPTSTFTLRYGKNILKDLAKLYITPDYRILSKGILWRI